ncbi:MAG: hypothetical protein Q4C58_11025 [Eubacteriales bacterium]|nr:hypothetical protein [Eubacteriales bacterium]
MKRIYEKPEIYVENFVLAQNIAYGCSQDGIEHATHSSKGDCGYEFGGDVIFLAGVAACDYQIEDGSFGEICYNNPAGSQLFSS